MAREITKLDTLINKRNITPTDGIIQSVSGNKMTIKTNKGTIIGTRAGTDSYKVGDKVSMVNGVVINKTASTGATLDVYYV